MREQFWFHRYDTGRGRYLVTVAELSEKRAFSLSEFQEWFEKAIASIPEQYRLDAAVEVAREYDDFAVTIQYMRPETDEEHALRLAENEANHAVDEAKRIARERRVYEDLKKKYG